MKFKIKIIRAIILSSLFLCVNPLHCLSSSKEMPSQIVIHNRILARINGKTISAYDVAKKMDVLFFSQFPEYSLFIDARYQFYQMNWRSVLEELINKELILADAQEHKIEISQGDTRQEIESVFGPNVHENLNKTGLSLDEATKLVQGDLIIRRMLNMRVNSKALRVITPFKVRQAYDLYIQDPINASLTKWNYRVITVKDRNLQKAQEISNKVYSLLIEQNIALEQLMASLKEKKILGRKSKVTISNDILNNEQELSETYKEILMGMDTGMISQPSLHKSRASQGSVYRIFYLKEKIPGSIPSFKEMDNKLKDKLLNEYADQETENYLKKLRQHYHFRDQDLESMFPSNYQPFTLK